MFKKIFIEKKGKPRKLEKGQSHFVTLGNN